MKGQSFMPDYMASMLVFAIVVTVFLAAWNSVVDNQAFFSEEDDLRLQAERTTVFLVSTPGSPENWESTGVNVDVPGFASSDHVLDPDKLDAFRDLSRDRQKRLLQTSNYYMVVRNQSSVLEVGGEDLEFGSDYGGADTIIPITREVVLNRSGELKTAELRYVVWQ